MSNFSQHAEEYLRLRQGLGHQLADAVRLLPRYVAHLEATGTTSITVEDALDWVQRPDACPTTSVWSRRMTVVRGFARYMSGIDPATQVPPFGLVTSRQRWRPPFIYSPSDVEALMAEVPRLTPSPFRAATFQTMIGLLAATGMRVGEAIRMTRSDLDFAEGVLVVKGSKFNKSRELPLHASTTAALASYATQRDRCVPAPKHPAFFLSAKGTPVIYTDFGEKFRVLLRASGVGSGSLVAPRIRRSPPFFCRPYLGALAPGGRGRRPTVAEAVDLHGAPDTGLHVLVPLSRARAPHNCREPPGEGERRLGP